MVNGRDVPITIDELHEKLLRRENTFTLGTLRTHLLFPFQPMLLNTDLNIPHNKAEATANNKIITHSKVGVMVVVKVEDTLVNVKSAMFRGIVLVVFHNSLEHQHLQHHHNMVDHLYSTSGLPIHHLCHQHNGSRGLTILRHHQRLLLLGSWTVVLPTILPLISEISPSMGHTTEVMKF